MDIFHEISPCFQEHKIGSSAGGLFDKFNVPRYWKLHKYLQPSPWLISWLRREIQAVTQVLQTYHFHCLNVVIFGIDALLTQSLNSFWLWWSIKTMILWITKMRSIFNDSERKQLTDYYCVLTCFLRSLSVFIVKYGGENSFISRMNMFFGFSVRLKECQFATNRKLSTKPNLHVRGYFLVNL